MFANCSIQTVLVCDLRNFTSYTENHEIHEVVDNIEQIVESLYKILEINKGQYVNFTGDGLIFSYDYEKDAIRAALEVRDFVDEFNKKTHQEKKFWE